MQLEFSRKRTADQGVPLALWSDSKTGKWNPRNLIGSLGEYLENSLQDNASLMHGKLTMW